MDQVYAIVLRHSPARIVSVQCIWLLLLYYAFMLFTAIVLRICAVHYGNGNTHHHHHRQSRSHSLFTATIDDSQPAFTIHHFRFLIPCSHRTLLLRTASTSLCFSFLSFSVVIKVDVLKHHARRGSGKTHTKNISSNLS